MPQSWEEFLQIRPLDESIVWYWLIILVAARKISGQESSTQIVIPVGEQDDLIIVVAFSSLLFFRGVNNEWADNTIGVLRAVMSMIPIGAVLVFNGEVIQEASPWRDRALCDSCSSVHPVGTVLEHSVPMNACCIGKSVRDIDQQPIATVGPY